MTRKSVWLASLAIAAMVVAMVVWGVVEYANASQTQADVLIEFLDSNGVEYSSREDMLELANKVCSLDARGVNTTEFLESAFNQHDAYIIQGGVLNSDYCE